MIVVIAGILTWLGTSVDNIIMIIVLSSDSSKRQRDILVGQLIATTVLLAFSFLAVAAIKAELPVSTANLKWVNILGIVPISIGTAKLLGICFPERKQKQRKIPGFAKVLLPGIEKAHEKMQKIPLWLEPAFLLVALGGDNIIVYITVFLSSSLNTNLLYTLIFYIGSGVICGISVLFRRITIKEHHLTWIQKYGPCLLILVGIYILARMFM